MKKFKATVQRRLWDAHSSGWDTMRSEPSALHQMGLVADALRECLPPAAAVVDLGCGAGQHAVAVAERGFQVTAVDYSTAMLERARRRAAGAANEIDVREVDLNDDLPFAAESFDGALCVSVLQVLDDPMRFLQQVRGSLRPHGHLLVESVRKLGALSRSDRLGVCDKAINACKIAIARLAPDSVREYTPDDITDLLHEAGFRVLRTDTYDATFTVLAGR